MFLIVLVYYNNPDANILFSSKGTPEFVTVSECVHYFEWRTYVACRRDKFRPHKEVSKDDEMC